MKRQDLLRPTHSVRIVTASSLFDGHDASINIMRRMLQASGAEVIHLGHNRSAREVVYTAIEEDVQAIAVSSYQGGHMEYFRYMIDLLKENDATHIRVFGGGGGTITPHEIAELHEYGVARIFSPEDGRTLGLQGMINVIIEQSDFLPDIDVASEMRRLDRGDHQAIARLISYMERKEKETGALEELAQTRK